MTWELWLTAFFSFVAIGTLIWFLEHRINEDFRGSTSHQVGTVFWFAFSTIVFTQKEKIISNLSKFVMIIWLLVVLILTQAYTASFTTMLTIQQLQPAVTDVNDLIANKKYVGYQRGSYVLGLLMRLGFDESRTLPYNTVDECHQLFESGTITAAFDEIPYIRNFLAIYCSKYTMIQPTYQTNGFGFVFPIGSPLVRDISWAVLNVTESDKMSIIDYKWIQKASNCPDSSPLITSYSLGLGSFWGLFMIVGVTMSFAFVIYIGMFLHEHWKTVTNPNCSIREKIMILARRFGEKKLSSQTFKNLDFRAAANIDRAKGEVVEADERMCDPQVTFSTQASPPVNTSPPSPSLSRHSDDNSNLLEEEEMTYQIDLSNSSQHRQAS